MTTKANIIIIEDEKNICSFIEHILEPQGYRVISANTGKEGLQYITSEHPDVILLDLGLPDMDGLKLIEQVRSWSITPIIVISARTLEKSKIAALDLAQMTISPSHLVQESFWHVSVPLCAIPSATSILEAPNTR